jgi:lactoylglutathione lyase
MSGIFECAFDHAHFLCSDVQATERWFVECLGAKLLGRREARGSTTTDLLLGGAMILLRGARKNEAIGDAGPARFGTDHLGLLVPDVDAAVQHLRLRGVEIIQEPTQVNPGLCIAYIRGPDQVRIELVQRAHSG